MPLTVPIRYQQGDLVYGADERDHGFLISNCDPLVATGTLVLTTGLQYFGKAWVPRTVTATNVWFYVSAIGVTLTAGANNQAIYDSAGNQLCATANQTTNYTTTGMKTVAFTTPTTIPGGPGVFVWLAIKATATTPPSIARMSANANAQNNANLSAALSRAATNGTATGALLPATITPSSNTAAGSLFWMAVT